MAVSSQLGIPRSTCANAERAIGGQRSPCPNIGAQACSSCFLVQYCGKKCQREHWSLHKADCQSPLRQEKWKPEWEFKGRRPAFVNYENDQPKHVFQIENQVVFGGKKYLWGNVSAIDALKLDKNEGAGYDQDLSLLFAASGDARHVVKTLGELPASYTAKCEVVINDKDFDIVARNTIFLLTALHFDPQEAVPIILHVWYSALIPEPTYRSLRANILPLIQDVCDKIKGREPTTLQSKKFTCGTRSLRLLLYPAQWNQLLSYFQVPDQLTPAEATKVRAATMLAPERKDYLERALYNQPGSWRACTMKFRADGLLVPFGASRAEFDTPNPTFYQVKDSWPMKDSADPLDGWSPQEVLGHASAAKNDVYGSLSYLIRDTLSKFCNRIANLNISIQLFHFNATELPEYLSNAQFDRIEVSNIIDGGYLGPQTTLQKLGPLLKRPAQNRNATLIGLFINAIHEVYTAADTLSQIFPETICLQEWLPLNSRMLGKAANGMADFHRLYNARALVRDYEALWERVEKMHELARASREAGLMMKRVNTVVEMWPVKLSDGATKEEFDVLLASGQNGAERYVEWKVRE